MKTWAQRLELSLSATLQRCVGKHIRGKTFNAASGSENANRHDKTVKTVKGTFCYDEGKPIISTYLDDTRLNNIVGYDGVVDRFSGCYLPSISRWSRLTSFDDIKKAFKESTVAKYSHCTFVKSVASFVLFVLGTNSKYSL